MKFDFLLNNRSKIEKIKVNSRQAHQEFSPPGRPHFPEEALLKKVKNAAVMPIISSRNGEAYVTLIIRTVYKGAHSGQIAFPGGKWEKNDQTFLETAYREVKEEIGIDKKELLFCRALAPVYISVSNFMVYPFLALAENPLSYKKQESEVTEVIEIPVKHLLSDKAKKTITVSQGKANMNVVPAFVYEEYEVWGATSMILNELKQVIIKTMH